MGFQRQVDPTPQELGAEYRRKYDAMVEDYNREVIRLEAKIAQLKSNRDNLKEYLDAKFKKEFDRIDQIKADAEAKFNEALDHQSRVNAAALALSKEKDAWREEVAEKESRLKTDRSNLERDRAEFASEVKEHNLRVIELDKKTADQLLSERKLSQIKQEIRNLLNEFEKIKNEPKAKTLKGFWEIEALC